MSVFCIFRQIVVVFFFLHIPVRTYVCPLTLKSINKLKISTIRPQTKTTLCATPNNDAKHTMR